MSDSRLIVETGAFGTFTVSIAGAKTGKFNRFHVTAATIVSVILDKEGNNVTTSYIQTAATALVAGGTVVVRPEHGYFSSVTKDAAGELVLVHANAIY